MTEFLLKLCGVQREDAARVSDAEFVLRNSQWLSWVIAAGVIMLGVVGFSYWRNTREIITARQRGVLIGLRGLLIALLLLLLLRPVVAFTLESSIRRELLML